MSANQNKSRVQIKKGTSVKKIIVIFAGLLLLLLMTGLSLWLGAAKIDFGTMIKALVNFDPKNQTDQIILNIRLPRVLGAVLVGACLAVSGSIMQGVTRNPLADSGLLGINSGAAFGLAVCFAFFPKASYNFILLASFLGAGIAVYLVYRIGSTNLGGLTPSRLILTGAAVSALFVALSEGIALYFNLSQTLAFWHIGGVSAATWSNLKTISPWFFCGMIVSFFLAKSITVLSLGDETAIGLGKKPKIIRLISILLVLILAGTAVSVVGSISFVGLMIPHIVRYLIGHDYRMIIPVSAIYGSILVVGADLIARMINPPFETPFGAVIALLGIPFFLFLARKGETR